MYNNRSHPLLEQIPLTVSPFVSLPTATTLSYNYKAMPSALPPSILPSSSADPSLAAAADPHNPNPDDPRNPEAANAGYKPKYIVSGTGHAAHPDDIIASCRALRAHLARMQEDADRDLREWHERRHARDLAEKRRVAPGWLDSDERMLQPEPSGGITEGVAEMSLDDVRTDGDGDGGGGGAEAVSPPVGVSEMDTDQGEELNRVFGAMNPDLR